MCVCIYICMVQTIERSGFASSAVGAVAGRPGVCIRDGAGPLLRRYLYLSLYIEITIYDMNIYIYMHIYTYVCIYV